ncbi:MAG: hypoxanthine phosphoribosyltransferase [Chitinophagales bacterium]
MIQIHGKQFELYLSQSQIATAVQQIAEKINADYQDEKVLLVAVLNGSFIFVADLMRCLKVDCQIEFIKTKSYEGMKSTGNVKMVLGLDMDLQDRHVVLLEDIVDTGNTLATLLDIFEKQQPKSLKVATLLFKSEALQHKDLPIDYIGIDIPNKFVVGYGLDYDDCGRQYADIYQVVV